MDFRLLENRRAQFLYHKNAQHKRVDHTVFLLFPQYQPFIYKRLELSYFFCELDDISELRSFFSFENQRGSSIEAVLDTRDSFEMRVFLLALTILKVINSEQALAAMRNCYYGPDRFYLLASLGTGNVIFWLP